MHKALGRGLESLLPKTVPEASNISENIIKVEIEKIKPNRFQPRLEFDNTKLGELAESIKEHGLAQPLVVTQSMVPGEYELIAGERRLRACKIADLKEVSCIVKQVNDKEKFQLSLIENLQREDLNPIEEARAYKRLSQEFELTQEDLAKTLGKDRSVIANTLRFLNLDQDIQEAIIVGAISIGHAKILAGIDDKTKQKMLGEKILREKLTVREIEKIVASWKSVLKSGKKKKKSDAELTSLAEELQRHLGAKVKIVGKPKKGKVEIFYYSLKELERLSLILRSKRK
ncbi:MAG: ParB/RepB/Spo0J family partition protein [Elusimicrobia bacterium]|nr:ParB/RepB/Spo0J family partition protein [Candidatus Liberimonas magnetica]